MLVQARNHSSLFILPWLYQLVQMFGWSMPRFVVGTVYGLLYAVWALAFIGGLGFAVVSLVSDANDAERQLPLAGMIVWIALYVVLLPLSAFTWGRSLRRLWKRSTTGGRHAGLPLSALPDSSYLEPFYWLYGWTVAFFFLMLLLYVFYFSNSVPWRKSGLSCPYHSIRSKIDARTHVDRSAFSWNSIRPVHAPNEESCPPAPVSPCAERDSLQRCLQIQT